MSIPDSPFRKTFSSACRKISHAYEPDSHSCSALVPKIHLFNEVIPCLLLSWRPHLIPYISQLLHLPFFHFWCLVPKITQLLLVHAKCLLIVRSAWSSFYPSTRFTLNRFLQLPFCLNWKNPSTRPFLYTLKFLWWFSSSSICMKPSIYPLSNNILFNTISKLSSTL